MQSAAVKTARQDAEAAWAARPSTDQALQSATAAASAFGNSTKSLLATHAPTASAAATRLSESMRNTFSSLKGKEQVDEEEEDEEDEEEEPKISHNPFSPSGVKTVPAQLPFASNYSSSLSSSFTSPLASVAGPKTAKFFSFGDTDDSPPPPAKSATVSIPTSMSSAGSTVAPKKSTDSDEDEDEGDEQGPDASSYAAQMLKRVSLATSAAIQSPPRSTITINSATPTSPVVATSALQPPTPSSDPDIVSKLPPPPSSFPSSFTGKSSSSSSSGGSSLAEMFGFDELGFGKNNQTTEATQKDIGFFDKLVQVVSPAKETPFAPAAPAKEKSGFFSSVTSMFGIDGDQIKSAASTPTSTPAQNRSTSDDSPFSLFKSNSASATTLSTASTPIAVASRVSSPFANTGTSATAVVAAVTSTPVRSFPGLSTIPLTPTAPPISTVNNTANTIAPAKPTAAGGSFLSKYF
jgi:hypothetical protein